MVVRLEIRPRLQLREDPKPTARRATRLSPWVLPAVAYWLAISGLTYLLLHWGESSPEQAHASVRPEPPALEAPATRALPMAHAFPAAHALPAAATAAEPSRASEAAPLAPADAAPEPLSVRLEAPSVSAPSIGDSMQPRETETMTSCEAASANGNEQLSLGAPRGAPDLTRDAFAAVLENGRYLRACPLPDHTALDICAAVQHGRAVGITVVATPANLSLTACARRAVARLQFPHSSRLDVTRTRFGALPP